MRLSRKLQGRNQNVTTIQRGESVTCFTCQLLSSALRQRRLDDNLLMLDAEACVVDSKDTADASKTCEPRIEAPNFHALFVF